ncbi:TPA: hypothetical protein DDW35_02395 [Candidatus Sumerlaeota bacterium]|nr:hypothetical protein [Candidatus Sumerlaeota bacterium]
MPRPLNVLRVITWLPVGGIERKIAAVLPRLDRNLFNPRVVCLRERGPLADDLEASGVPVDVCPFKSRLSPSGIWRLAGLMKQHKIDIVHAHMYRSNTPATVAAKLAGVPVVIAHVHNVNTWETRRQLMMDRFLSRWRQVMVGVSDRVRQDIVNQLHLPSDKTRTLYNGVDIERFQDNSLRAPMRKTLGIADNELVIINHGRLVSQKNPQVFIRVAEEIAKTRQNVRILIAGDGGLREELEKIAAQKSVADKIQFLGKRDDIPELLQAADLYMMASFKEGFSNALIEAMAAGLPVVATDVGGNAEAVEQGKSGVIVPPHDDDAFVAAVARLVDNADERARLSEGARTRAQRFSLNNMVAEVQALYLELAQKAKLAV